MPKLPAPIEKDSYKGIRDASDMDSYRVEKQTAMHIQLPDADAEIEQAPSAGGGFIPEAELDRLSNIIKSFKDRFGKPRDDLAPATLRSILKQAGLGK